MSKTPATLPKGTRDFSPAVMAKRNYLFSTIRSVFEKFGFEPLETPAFENLSVLTGKYGDEGDQLMFKILNSGDFLKSTQPADIAAGSGAVSRKIAEKALRYDLTVPLARFVVMNRNALTFPFKRYQIQPVWRADRPQRGRFREFYQCDADVLGTPSLLCEAEIVMMMEEVLTGLGLTDFTIRVNHRLLLRAMVALSGHPELETGIITAIDKLDKISWSGVAAELEKLGLASASISAIEQFLDQATQQKSYQDTLAALKTLLPASDASTKALADLAVVAENLALLGANTAHVQLDATLARGLSYYTGCIFEVKVNNVNMGSVSGGGRYDNLTGAFGMPGVSGVGFSFGVDRLYEVLEELQLFPATAAAGTQVLIANFGRESTAQILLLLSQMRAAGIRAEFYPDEVKLKKQLDYANAKAIRLVLLAGSEELENQALQLKDMITGTQNRVQKTELITYLKEVLA